MSMKERIVSDMKDAMKAKDKLRLTTIRAILAEFTAVETAGKSRKELTDTDEISVLRKMVKTREESAKIYENAGSQVRADTERAEIAVIADYVPTQLSEIDTRKLVESIIADKNLADAGPRGIGQVMGTVKSRTDVNPATVSAIAKELLV